MKSNARPRDQRRRRRMVEEDVGEDPLGQVRERLRQPLAGQRRLARVLQHHRVAGDQRRHDGVDRGQERDSSRARSTSTTPDAAPAPAPGGTSRCPRSPPAPATARRSRPCRRSARAPRPSRRRSAPAAPSATRARSRDRRSPGRAAPRPRAPARSARRAAAAAQAFCAARAAASRCTHALRRLGRTRRVDAAVDRRNADDFPHLLPSGALEAARHLPVGHDPVRLRLLPARRVQVVLDHLVAHRRAQRLRLRVASTASRSVFGISRMRSPP